MSGCDFQKLFYSEEVTLKSMEGAMAGNLVLDLRKFVAPEFVFGLGAAGLAGRFARNLAVKKALVVSEPPLVECGWTGKAVDSLKESGVDAEMFLDVTPNPRDLEVMTGSEVYRREGCDSIVAVGGGSAMDCAKAIGIVCSNGLHVLEFEGVDNVKRPGPPLICIPTTSGTAAEVSQFAIITDTTRKVKIAIVSKTVIPDAALIDPELTVTMDAALTANTGLDALTHAVEAYVSNANSPITDLFSLEAVRRIRDNLLRAVEQPKNLEVRAGMLLASLYAGLGFSNAILGAVHAMAHSLGGFLDLPHGQCNAILLDYVIDYNFDAASDRYADIGRALGAEIPEGMPLDETRDAVLDVVRTLKRAVGVTQRLGELGVTAEVISALAEKAINDPCMFTNPKEASAEDICKIYEQAC